MRCWFGLYSPAAICRMEHGIVSDVKQGRHSLRTLTSCGLAVCLGAIPFGVAFGIWRSPFQALVSGLKMPVLIFSTILISAAANTLLAQVLGARLSFRKVLNAMAFAFAITSVMLGSLSPATCFLAMQAPQAGSAEQWIAYRQVLLINSAWIALCGLTGNACLYRLLRGLTSSRATAARVLLSWILMAGLAGSELAWILSPFLAKPGIPVPLINPDAFRGNIFEYVVQTVTGGLR
ncbi:hypothetical protein ACFLSJ_02695 [Verrucomicrobiota bacterium]